MNIHIDIFFHVNLKNIFIYFNIKYHVVVFKVLLYFNSLLKTSNSFSKDFEYSGELCFYNLEFSIL